MQLDSYPDEINGLISMIIWTIYINYEFVYWFKIFTLIKGP